MTTTTRRGLALAPKSCRWGGRWTGTPFCIPYEALLSLEISNLLAAEKCFSVSHMANGATRLQPLILNIGQAAGLAAALASRRNISPHDLPSALIQQQLISDRWAPAAVLPIWDWPGWHPNWQEAQARGLRNLDAVRVDGSSIHRCPKIWPGLKPIRRHGNRRPKRFVDACVAITLTARSSWSGPREPLP